ncbi:hypothetical protein ERHA54_40420 [Erwinia rhapontici]|uniref:Transmembrane protein n=2 Tax=Erwiniaceae TaxID=1903409 RepID=A0ABM7N4R5_ERWRD|nr:MULTISPECIES: hypothetical protein [Erwinia]MBP2152559.1 hypothetical protein [Erwinia rhapontici]TDT00359.1 hypothetical protein EDF84_10279 [Erwinia rhapontici]BCQ36445.1 hypothetical protein ERHA53_37880 [Erwinia rhapontici]BCQ41439.1 hypothetical protein ERHA54_40420 [Erwinia rhapontici]BCQ46735.1 hypothetical protein ERHA55_42620 [Erwinia rhapontici]
MNPFFYSKKSIFSKVNMTVLAMFLVMGLWFWYMIWASILSHRTVLMEFVPEWMVYITTGAVIGLFFAGRTVYRRPVNKTPKYVLEMFFGGFCFGFICVLNIFDVYIYCFPDNLIRYESEYEVVFPGPSRGKSGHCEAGLWIKDPHTNRWLQLCTNKKELSYKRRQGMDRVWVTAKVNHIGSYIVEYEFVYH